MQTIEFFCGTKSFSKVAAARGCRTFTVDIDAAHHPDLAQDIRLLAPSDLPQNIDVLWASPPCNAFSVAAIAKNWNADGTPKPSVDLALAPIAKTMALIRKAGPRRGSRTGTQRINMARERARIPALLFQEIFTQLSQETPRV